MPVPYVAKRRITDANGNTAPLDIVLDNLGNAFSPGSCSHTFAYNGSNQVTSDTASDGTTIRVKTFTWSGTNLATASAWVVS